LQWDLENLPKRAQDPFTVPPDQMAETMKILESWKGKTLYDLWANSCPEEIANKTIGTGWADVCAGVFFLGYHFTPPWEMILSSGFTAFEEKINARFSRLDLSDPKDIGVFHLLKALLIAIEAIKTFANRHADEAERLASIESDLGRKEELVRIVEACRRVPFYGARSFYDSASIIMVHAHTSSYRGDRSCVYRRTI